MASLFSFGGSKSESRSTSDAYGVSGSASDSVSGGFSRSGGTSRQDIAFEDLFSKLYGGASAAAGGIDPSVLTDQANLLFSGGVGFLDKLGGGAETDYLASRVSGESPVLQEQIDALGGDIGEFFREEINPAITSEAVAGGTLGGGRQGVAQGQAAEAAAREFQRGATSLRSADIAARDAAAGTLGQQRIGAAGTGLAALPGLGNIADLGFGAELDPYTQLAAIMGGPTTLTQSDQFATSEDFARAFSRSFAEDFAHSESTSKGKSVSFGFGGK